MKLEKNVKYNIIPGFSRYIIYSSGRIRLRENMGIFKEGDDIPINFENGKVNLFSDEKSEYVMIDLPKLLASIFVGNINLPVKYSIDNCGYKMLNYDMSGIVPHVIDSSHISILGIIFTKIPNLSNYFISTNSLIYSIRLKHFLKKSFNKVGYLRVHLELDDGLKTKDFLIHHLVYSTYIGQIHSGFHIDHIDNNKLNNDVSNLQLLSARDNVIKSLRFHKIANFSDDEIRYICSEMSVGISSKDIATKMGITDPHEIRRFIVRCNLIRRGVLWTEISKDYSFDKYVHTKWTESDIKFICSEMSNGTSVVELFEHYNITDPKDKSSFKTLCSALRNKRIWRSISEKYDFSNYKSRKHVPK